MKNILLPTDFSQNSLNAIHYGMKLYANRYCEFYFLNAFQINMYTLDNMMVPEPGDNTYDTAKKHSDEGFVKLKAILNLQESNPKHSYRTISTFNYLLEAVRDTIAKKDIDLVIMGTKGLTSSEAKAFGSNTINIMEKIVECPVMAIPEQFDYSPPKQIVFPTNYKAHFKRKELKYLLEIAELHDSQIHVIHVERESKLSKKQENNKKLLESIFDGIDFENHTLPKDKVQKAIFSFIESRKCDMIVFVNKKHWFFGSILANPLVKELGYDATIPILELNDNS
ncbi:universal stress protein [Flagellimonas pacifica]|uniref:Nucleotide-binding universal stress protein, UspA family n=1 Tax=Flagellimonas pacifica TaxID=1247520 RepID=A0A285MU71_9FLAO|nr:universal stress protein [Allomuricauda parva]SNZ00740.1 Nucleotide-binding universal stress protein, UspA family [Allomuricauda parva]